MSFNNISFRMFEVNEDVFGVKKRELFGEMEIKFSLDFLFY